MGKVTWRGVQQHPVRFLLSVLAVVLGIAFVSGTFSLRTMLSSTFDSIIDQSMTADVYLRGAEAETEGSSDADFMGESTRPLISMDLADTVAAVPGVDLALPDVQGTMVLVGADGTAVQGGGAPSLVVAGYPDSTGFAVSEGRLATEPGEMAIESSSLERSGLKLGDTTKVILGGEITEQEIVGVLAFDAPMAGATLVALDPGMATSLFAPDGEVGMISVDAAEGSDVEELVRAIGEALPADSGAEVVSGEVVRTENKETMASQMGFIETFLMIFAAIALFVGAFIIANTFAMVVRQRMAEIAVLRAIGASPVQVFVSVVGQAAIVGLVGSALGVLGGLGLVAALRVVFGQMGMELAGSIPLDARTVLVSLAIGTGVAIVAAALPARRAAKVPPVEAMREQISTAEHSLLLRGIAGAVLVLGGIGAVVVSLGDGDQAETLLGAGSVAVLLGALVVSPVIAPAILRVLAWPVQAIRPLGRLARGNVTRNPRRTANTSGALMIGMALVGAASVLAASTQASMASIIESDLKADFVLRGATFEIPAGASTDAEEVDGVERLDRYYFGGLDVDGKQQWIAAGDAGMFEHSIDPRIEEGSLDAFADGEAMVQKSYAEDNGLVLGDLITVDAPQVPGSEQTLRVGAIIDSRAVDSPVILPTSVYEQIVPEEQRAVATVFITAADGRFEEVREGLVDAVKPYLVVSVLDQEEFTSALTDQVNQMLVVLYALLGLSIVIAVLGIVNTLALSIMERTREIGLMRAVGLGRLQLSGTVVIESVLIAVFGAVAGLAIGVGLASAMPSVFADVGMAELVIPWAQVGVMFGLAGIVGVVAALWPAVRAARLPVLQAVTYD